MDYLKFLTLEQQISELSNSEVDAIFEKKIKHDVLISRDINQDNGLLAPIQMLVNELGDDLYLLSEVQKKLTLLIILRAEEEIEELLGKYSSEKRGIGRTEVFFGRISPFSN